LVKVDALRANLDDIYHDALRLPDESKAQLVERLIEYFATHILIESECTSIMQGGEKRN
jgi:hypothetical protein